MKKLNWKHIQEEYNKGYTIADLCVAFSCSHGAFEAAKRRGEFHPRNKSDCQTKKKEIVIDRLIEIGNHYSDGKSWRDILKLGFTQSEFIAAKKEGYVIPRTLSESRKISIQKYGPSRMGNAAKKKLSIKQSLNNSGGKCKWYEVAGQKVQGTWERNVALKLEELGIRWYKPKVHKDVWSYKLNDKNKSYTPDLYLIDLDLYLEIKGHWWGNDKDKMDAVLEQHPDKNLLIIEKDQYQKILQGELVWL